MSGFEPRQRDTDDMFDESNFSDDDPDYECPMFKLLYIIMEDDKDAFVECIREEAEEIGYDVYQSLKMSDIINEIFLFNAVKCATALLQGETCLKPVLINAVHPESGKTALHQAMFHTELTELFLRYGARTDVRCKKGMLPLTRALKVLISEVAYLCGWPSRQSIYMNIAILIGELKYRKRGLETIRLLFRATKEVDQEIYHYAMEGRVIEIMYLMMAAREEVTSPSLFKDLSCHSTLNGVTSLHGLVVSQISALATSRVTLVSTNDEMPNKLNDDNKLETMKSMLRAIEIFEKIGDKIELLTQNNSYKGSVVDFATEGACLLIREGFAKFEDFELKRCDELKHLTDGELLSFHEEFFKLLESKVFRKNQFELLPTWITHIGNHVPLIAIPQLFNLQRQASTQISVPESLKYEMCLDKQLPTLEAIQILGYNDDSRCKSALQVLLQRLRHHPYLEDWTFQKSIFKLVCILCLQQLRESLESTQLVPSKTNENETIARDGSIIKLPPLLMPASEEVFTATSPGKVIPQCLRSDMGMIIETGDNSITQFLNSDPYNAGSRSSLPIAREIQFLLGEAGFRLKPEDTDLNYINCFSATLDPVDCTHSSKLVDPRLSAGSLSLAKDAASLPLIVQQPREFLVAEKKHLWGAGGTLRAPSAQGLGAAGSRLFHTMAPRNSKCHSSLHGIPKCCLGKKTRLCFSIGFAISKVIK